MPVGRRQEGLIEDSGGRQDRVLVAAVGVRNALGDRRQDPGPARRVGTIRGERAQRDQLEPDPPTLLNEARKGHQRRIAEQCRCVQLHLGGIERGGRRHARRTEVRGDHRQLPVGLGDRLALLAPGRRQTDDGGEHGLRRSAGHYQPRQAKRRVERLGETPEHDVGDDRLRPRDRAAPPERDEQPGTCGQHRQWYDVQPRIATAGAARDRRQAETGDRRRDRADRRVIRSRRAPRHPAEHRPGAHRHRHIGAVDRSPERERPGDRDRRDQTGADGHPRAVEAASVADGAADRHARVQFGAHRGQPDHRIACGRRVKP
ncbi:MAG: hypothetical protein ACYDHH_28545 [Solirubrobacteraceae bacterium]